MAEGRQVAVTAWLCAGILVVATAISCGVDSFRGSGGDASPSELSMSAPTLAAMTGSLVLASDGRTLIYPQAGGECPFAPPHIIETATVVDIARTVYPAGATCPQRPANADIGSIKLAAPLGGRHLVSAVTQATVPVIAESEGVRLATVPAYLFSASGSPLGDVLAGAPGFTGGATMAEIFAATDGAPVPPGSELWIVVSTGTWRPDATTTPIAVRGHAGMAGPGALVWAERGLTIGMFWHLAPTSVAPMPAAATLMALAGTLVRVSV